MKAGFYVRSMLEEAAPSPGAKAVIAGLLVALGAFLMASALVGPLA